MSPNCGRPASTSTAIPKPPRRHSIIESARCGSKGLIPSPTGLLGDRTRLSYRQRRFEVGVAANGRHAGRSANKSARPWLSASTPGLFADRTRPRIGAILDSP